MNPRLNITLKELIKLTVTVKGMKNWALYYRNEDEVAFIPVIFKADAEELITTSSEPGKLVIISEEIITVVKSGEDISIGYKLNDKTVETVSDIIDYIKGTVK